MTEALNYFFKDVTRFPKVQSAVWNVWLRNFIHFRNTILVSFFWITFEPLMYLLAIGYGLGQFIGEIDGVPYIQFYFPALLATTAMMVSFFESTYSSFARFREQKVYETMLLAPISSDEVVFGEVLWAATKGLISVLTLLLIGFFFGLIKTWNVLPALLLLWVVCWFFASFGALMTSLARSSEDFIFSQTALVIPMSLFCGTYFPTSELPFLAEKIVWVLPLTHAVSATRSLLAGFWPTEVLYQSFALLVLALALMNWAIARMSRRLAN